MGKHAEVHNIIGRIYDCVSDPCAWNSTMTAVSDHFDASVACVAIGCKTSGRARLRVAGGNPAVYEPLLQDCPAANLPIFNKADGMELDTTIPALDFMKLLGPRTALSIIFSPITAQWAIPNKIRDCMMASVLDHADSMGMLTVITNSERGRLTRADHAALDVLAPHVRRAATITDLFDIKPRSLDLFESVIDAFAHAVLVVDQDMRLLYANPAAESVLRGDGSVAYQKKGKLCFTAPLSHTAIENAVKLGQLDEVALGRRGIDIPVTPQVAHGVAHVLPLQQRTGQASKLHKKGVAAIFLALAGSSTLPAMDAVAALFGLTPAEKRVARLLSEGRSRIQIAQASGVTDNTVRTQLDAIYSKTGVNSQRELERLIFELTPSVRQRDSSGTH